MIDTSLLSEVCRIPGAPGYEQPIRAFLLDKVAPYVDEVRVDAMGSIHALKKGKSDKKLMIAAHMDEISFIATHVDEEGFVRFQPLGGFDPKTLTAQRVIIHGTKDIIGVMGTKPIHIMRPEERKKMPEVTDFFIDTGYTKEEVQEMVPIGSPITRERELIEIGHCVNAKSIDNRVSVFVLLEALRELRDEELSCDVYAVFTVQEEVGLRGAMTSASGIDPDFGIVLDVTLACDVPGIQAHEKVTKLGSGTAIKVLDGSTICDYRMVQFMRELAQEKGIRHQMEILPAGGTDAAGIQRNAKGGSITGGISVPTRYLHQVIETAHKQDIRDTIDLLKATLLNVSEYDWTFR
ncbi:MAG: M42 family metallopeptidase [Bacteroidota bacterium]